MLLLLATKSVGIVGGGALRCARYSARGIVAEVGILPMRASLAYWQVLAVPSVNVSTVASWEGASGCRRGALCQRVNGCQLVGGCGNASSVETAAARRVWTLALCRVNLTYGTAQNMSMAPRVYSIVASSGQNVKTAPTA